MPITFNANIRFTCTKYRLPRNWTRKVLKIWNGHNFWLECMIDAHDISRPSKLNNESSQEILMALNFHSDVQFTCIIYRHPRNWTRKLLTNSNGHNVWLECMIDAHDISRRSKLNNRSSREIQISITFLSDVWFKCIIYRDPWNWPLKLSTNSNGHNFWLECMIDAHDISRRSKLNNGSSREIQMAITFHSNVRFTCIIYQDPWNWPRKLSANSNGHNFWFECMIDAHDISRHSKLNNGSSRLILMAITFHSIVWLTCIINRDPRNWPRKLSTNSNGHNFWLECMIDTHDWLRRSKLNNGSSREILMAITFHSDVWFTCIIYRDPWNWPRNLPANSNGHNFWLECMIDAHDISRRSKLNDESSQEILMALNFHSNVRFTCIINRDPRNWPRKLWTNSNGHIF